MKWLGKKRLFARLHRFYRKKLPAVRWLPFFASQWFITLNIASQFGYLVQFFKKFQYSLILNAFRCSSSECGLQVFQWAGPCRLSPHILCFGCAALLQRMTGSWSAFQQLSLDQLRCLPSAHPLFASWSQSQNPNHVVSSICFESNFPSTSFVLAQKYCNLNNVKGRLEIRWKEIFALQHFA